MNHIYIARSCLVLATGQTISIKYALLQLNIVLLLAKTTSSIAFTTLNNLVTNSRFLTRLNFPLRYSSLFKKTFVQAYDKLVSYQARGNIFSCFMLLVPSSKLSPWGYGSGLLIRSDFLIQILM